MTVSVSTTDFSRFMGFESRPAKAKKREMLPDQAQASFPAVAERGAISFAQSGDNATSHPLSQRGKTVAGGTIWS